MPSAARNDKPSHGRKEMGYDPSVKAALGMTALALGSVGMLLFFLPILGMPLSALGLLLGVGGVVVALLGGPSSLRWSILGVALCLLAGVINLAIYYAPAGYIPNRVVPQMWLRPPDRPYVPPPAAPSLETTPAIASAP